MMNSTKIGLGLGGIALLALVGCGGEMRASKSSPGTAYDAPPPAAYPAGQPGMAPPAQAEASVSADKSASPRATESPAEPTNRPGLGTEWGETRFSHITQVAFIRADADQPLSTA